MRTVAPSWTPSSRRRRSTPSRSRMRSKWANPSSLSKFVIAARRSIRSPETTKTPSSIRTSKGSSPRSTMCTGSGVANAFAGRRRDAAQPRPLAAQFFEALPCERDVEFRDDREAGALEQGGIPGAQFVFDRGAIGEELVAALRPFDQVDEDTGPLDVSQETIAQPGPFVSAFDQPRDIDHDERGLIVDPNDAQVGLEGRERIVGDLRAGRRDDREQGRFAGIREPD